MLRSTAFVSTLLALTACGGGATSSSTGAAEPLSEQVETTNYLWHFASGDSVDTVRQEAFHDWLSPRIAVSLPVQIQYYKYRSRAHMLALTGRSANGFAEPERFEVYSIFSWHSHESVHVYSALVGRPSDFFNEGLAVALSIDPLAGRFEGSYSGESVHAWARRNQSGLQPIENMVTTEAFRGYEEALAYQEAGSFMEFLLEVVGFEPVWELFWRGRREDTLETVRNAFRESFGFPLVEAERRWRTFLESGG